MQSEEPPIQSNPGPAESKAQAASTPIASESAQPQVPSPQTGSALPQESPTPQEGLSETAPSAAHLLFEAEKRLQLDIADALAGASARKGAPQQQLTELCRVIDFWLDNESGELIDRLGLISLAEEIKKDYVTCSFLAWRGEFKIAYITLRSFLESFCLLLYYLNQGCDRNLFLRGKGYKLMLHRMAQKKAVPDEMHAFRRHYHLLVEDSYGSVKAADKFFDEIDACYGVLSKAVHGDYSVEGNANAADQFIATLGRVLRVCNTLALHEPMLDITDDILEEALGTILVTISWRPQ